MTTIHGFCNRLLAAHPVAAGIDPGFRVLDAPEADAGRARGLRRARSSRVPRRTATAAAREETVAAFDIDGLRAIVSGVHAELRSRGEAEPRLPEPPPSDPVEAIARAIEAAAGGAGGAEARAIPNASWSSGRWRGSASPAPPPALDELRRCAPTARRRRSPPTARRSTRRSRARAEAGEGGEAYRHLAELLALFSAPLRGGQGTPRRDRLRGPADPRRAAARAGRDRRGLPGPLQPPAGRRVPGHQPPAAAADRGAARARAASWSWSATSCSRSTASATPTSTSSAGSGELIEAARRRRADGAERQLPLAAGGDRRRQPLRRARCSATTYRPLRVGAPPRPSRRRPAQGPAVELLLTAPRRLGRGGDRARAGDRRPHAAQLPGRGARPRRAPARARRRGRRRAARWSCCCAPSPTSTPTRTRWSAPACAPTWSAAAATGPSSRSPTSARCWRRSPTRSTTRRCSAPSPRPPAASPRTRSGCCARRRAGGATSGRRWSAAAGARRGGAGRARAAASRSPSAELALLRELRRDDRAACASAARGSRSPA